MTVTAQMMCTVTLLPLGYVHRSISVLIQRCAPNHSNDVLCGMTAVTV